MLDDITLYWLTNTGTSAAQLYWENVTNNFNTVEQKTAEITLPVAITVFPGEIYRAPRSWAERAYRNLIYYKRVDMGGPSPRGKSHSSSPRSSGRPSGRSAEGRRAATPVAPGDRHHRPMSPTPPRRYRSESVTEALFARTHG